MENMDMEATNEILMNILSKLEVQEDIADTAQVWQASYPNDGTRADFAVGTTVIDFDAGTVMTPAGVVTTLSSSLRRREKLHMESVAINISAASVLIFDSEDKFAVEAGTWYVAKRKEFVTLQIIVESAANGIVLASSAQDDLERMTDHAPVAFAYESITVAATAIGGTAGTYLDAVRAEATVETAQIRMRLDGTAPTSSEGHIVEIGDIIILASPAHIAAFEAIRTGAVSGVLKVTYFH